MVPLAFAKKTARLMAFSRVKNWSERRVTNEVNPFVGSRIICLYDLSVSHAMIRSKFELPLDIDTSLLDYLGNFHFVDSARKGGHEDILKVDWISCHLMYLRIPLWTRVQTLQLAATLLNLRSPKIFLGMPETS